MGDHLWAGKSSRHVHRGQLSLAIRPWAGAVSTRLPVKVGE